MTQKPKIMHLIHDDGPGGGPQAIVQELAAFRERAEQVVVHGGSGRIAAFAGSHGIACHQIPIDRKRKIPAGAWALARLMRRYRPDVLLLHGQWAGPVGAVVGRLCGVPRMIYLAHWPSFYTDWDSVRVLRNHWVERIPCRIADETVTITESSRYQYLLRGLVREEHVHVVPHTLDLTARPSESDVIAFRQRVGMSSDHEHVVCASRIDTQKRLDWLLRAWPLILRERPAARLWIAGDGPLMSELRRLREALQVQETCTLLGAIPSGMLLFAAGDVAVSTSLYESFGYVALESMACGKPMVAMEVDGLRNVMTDGVHGLLTPPGRLDAFAGAVSRLCGDPALRACMGAAGREAAASYSPNAPEPHFEKLWSIVQGDGVAN